MLKRLLGAAGLAWLLGTAAALAAPTPNSAIMPQTPKEALGTVTNASGTTPQTLYAAGTNGSKVVGISCSNTDTSSYTLQLFLRTAATNYVLTSATIAVSAGNVAATAPLALLSSSTIPGIATDAAGQPYLYLNSGDSLMIGTTVTVTSGKQIACEATIGDF